MFTSHDQLRNNVATDDAGAAQHNALHSKIRSNAHNISATTRRPRLRNATGTVKGK
jgi:hypothetical protein